MANASSHPAKAAPSLNLPSGPTCKVQIIDSTTRVSGPCNLFMYPTITGHENLSGPAYSFLVEQVSSGRKILFDLGVRKDWHNFSASVNKLVTSPGWILNIEKNVAEILQENGVDVAGGAVEAIVWSHWHFDHTGDPSTFPGSTALITGPGVKEAFLPAYPAGPESPLLETDFAGREHREIDFEKGSVLQLGRFRGIDYFGDGSFYLLDSPGHAIGHICGLARVTSTQEGDAEDTFIFMGADTAHHGGEFRPTEYLPLPKEIKPSPYVARFPSICPGHIFEAIHRNNSTVEPFYRITTGVAHDTAVAEDSIDRMQDFDAAKNVFIIIAHDEGLLDAHVGIEWFPHGTLKNWKAKGQADKVRWSFLKDFTKAVEEKVDGNVQGVLINE